MKPKVKGRGRVRTIVALPLLLMAVVVACFPGARPPSVPPNGTLGLKGIAGSAEDTGPLKVVFASPKGKLAGPSEITVLFNKPLRSLEVAGKEAPFPAVIDPPIAGTWQWTGTRAASFVPARPDGKGGSFRLPKATSYKVTIPKGTKSLDGDALAEDYKFSFETERPRVVRTEPYAKADDLEPTAKFTVMFDQPMDDAEVAQRVVLVAAGKPIVSKVVRPEASNEKRFTLTPDRPLPTDAEITLEVKKGLRGKEGPLLLEDAQRFTFRTYGPLSVAELRCAGEIAADGKCDAPDGVRVSMTNAVKFKDLKRAISIDPPVKITWPSWMSDDDQYEHIDLVGRFVPGSTYTITVRTPLSDVHGQSLDKAVSKKVAFGDLAPTARIGLTSGVLEASAKREVTVGYINTSDLEVGTLKLDEEAILSMASEKLAFADIVKHAAFSKASVKKGRTNVLERHKVSLDSVLGSKGRGPFAITASYTSEGNKQTDRTIAQITDLGISAKVSKQGTVVLVTRLADASAVPDAEVKIRRPGKPAITKKTDAQGFASFGTEFSPNFRDEDAVIFVRTTDDFAFKEVSDNVYSAFDPSDDGAIGMLFDDRGIYRPGETAHVKGILRDPISTGMQTPAQGSPIAIAVESPDGEKIPVAPVSTSAFGTFAFDVKIPNTGRLGTYYVRASRGGEMVAEEGLEVAEFRPAEFKVAVESDKPSYVRGDTAKWTGRGDYLYGAPMAGSRAELSASRSVARFSPPNTRGFVTSDDAYQDELPDRGMRRYQLYTTDVKLDATGSTSASAPLDMPGQTGPERVVSVVDVTDVSRQMVSGSTTAIVHPAEHYVAVHLERTLVDAKTRLSPTFVAVRPDGERVPGASLRVSFIKRTWAVAKQGSGAEATTISTPVDTVVSSCALVSAAAPVGCDVTPTDAGRYIVRVTSEDRRKNPVAAAVDVYVVGESGDALSPFAQQDGPRIELVADKETYQVGDKAKVLVKSSWKGAEALVTVERSGIFEKRRVKLVGAAPTIDVTITEDMRPNAFLSVLVLKGRTKKAPAGPGKPDVGAPDFLLGETNLVVDPESKRLRVDVKPTRSDLRPGDEAEVALKVTDPKGKGVKTELTVYAVDEGVLSLVGYDTPDPLETFGAPRPLHVATLETRGDLAKLFDPLTGVGIDKGLDGGGGGSSSDRGVRGDFRANAYFNAAVLTNDDGDATVKFKLPDGLTTYRVMAVAVSQADRFGAGESKITTSRTLMARPALPRFLRAGDAFEASVVVSSKSSATQEVDVAASFKGVVAKGDTKKRVTVEPGRSVEVRFSAEAPRVTTATFQFSVQAGAEKDAVKLERRIQLPVGLESVALYGNTTSASAEKLGDLSEIRDDAGELTITTASTALVGLDTGASQLLDYPYGCTEQLTSRLVPLVGMKDLAKDFNLPLPANLDDVVEKTVAKILGHQRFDGSFGFWPDSPEPNAWATAYALWGLDQAKKKGHPVPKSAIDRAAEYLSHTLEAEEEKFTLNVGPFAVYVLAEVGKPDPGRTTRLFERRAGMPVFAKAFLASAMALTKGDGASIAALAKELEASVRVDGNVARVAENLGDDYAVYLDSDTRTSAMVLRALLHANPQHPLAPSLAMGLLASRDGGNFRSTQEGAWALLALGDYRRAQESTEPNFSARVFFGEALHAEQAFRGRSIVPQTATFATNKLLKQGGSVLSFQVEGEGKLFYEARLRYARKKLPTDVVDRGFYVEERYRKVTPDTLEEALDTVPDATSAAFLGGDLILADVVVVTPKPRRFVAIDAQLPAGFEAVDTRLATTSGRVRGVDKRRRRPVDEDDAAMERAERETYFTREVRDDRVVFFVDEMPAGIFRYRFLARATSLGTFVHPPTKAEEMYAPEIFGRTETKTITITAP